MLVLWDPQGKDYFLAQLDATYEVITGWLYEMQRARAGVSAIAPHTGGNCISLSEL